MLIHVRHGTHVKTRGETDASFSLANGKSHTTEMHKVCLPPKVGVLQKLVLMNLSQDCNLQRLKQQFKRAKRELVEGSTRGDRASTLSVT